jgi:uncharacterized protein YndB with AHSA1/START domain
VSARNRTVTKGDPREIVITRLFDATRETVFAAWSTADHLKHWFAPAGYSVTFCTVEFRVGGAWRLRFQHPDGRDVWARGTFREIVAPERIVFTDIVVNEDDAPRLEVLTTVTFAEERGKTRLTVQVHVVELFDPSAAPIVARLDSGWRETVEKLAQHIAFRQDDDS